MFQPHDDDDVEHGFVDHDLAHNPDTHIDRNIDTLDIPIPDLLISRRPDDHDHDPDHEPSTNTSGLITDAHSPEPASHRGFGGSDYTGLKTSLTEGGVPRAARPGSCVGMSPAGPGRLVAVTAVRTRVIRRQRVVTITGSWTLKKMFCRIFVFTWTLYPVGLSVGPH